MVKVAFRILSNIVSNTTVELFCKTRWPFLQKAPPQMFDWIPNAPPIGGTVNWGVGRLQVHGICTGVQGSSWCSGYIFKLDLNAHVTYIYCSTAQVIYMYNSFCVQLSCASGIYTKLILYEWLIIYYHVNASIIYIKTSFFFFFLIYYADNWYWFKIIDFTVILTKFWLDSNLKV